MTIARGDRRCPSCLQFPDSYPRHWGQCVPRQQSPQWVRDGFASLSQWESSQVATTEGDVLVDAQPTSHPCPDCDRTFGTPHGLLIHARKAHKAVAVG